MIVLSDVEEIFFHSPTFQLLASSVFGAIGVLERLHYVSVSSSTAKVNKDRLIPVIQPPD